MHTLYYTTVADQKIQDPKHRARVHNTITARRANTEACAVYNQLQRTWPDISHHTAKRCIHACTGAKAKRTMQNAHDSKTHGLQDLTIMMGE